MSLKAIDGQMVLHKTSEIGRLQKLELQQGQQRQDNALMQVKKEATKNQEVVGQVPFAEHNKINDREASEQQHQQQEQKELIAEQTETEEELKLETHLGSYFDVRI